MKRKITKILITLITGLLVTVTAFAQDTLDESCFDNYDVFISSVISYDDFSEYWKDIFERYNKNVCHYMDIQNIQKQIDNLMTQIRDTYLKCNTANVLQLIDKFHTADAELFYLRNFIDIPNSEIQKIPDEKVWNLFRSRFVINKKYFDEVKAKQLFDQYKTKYTSRITTTYANCDDASIEKLTEKWNSLVKNLKSLGTQGAVIKENWGKATSTPPTGMKGFLNGIENLRFNNLPALKTPDQIYTQLVKDVQKTSGSEPTIDQLQQTIIQTQQDYGKKVTSTSIKADYEALYKQGGDQLSKDYAAKIQEMIDAVNATFDPLTKLTNCTKKTGERQCQ